MVVAVPPNGVMVASNTAEKATAEHGNLCGCLLQIVLELFSSQHWEQQHLFATLLSCGWNICSGQLLEEIREAVAQTHCLAISKAPEVAEQKNIEGGAGRLECTSL